MDSTHAVKVLREHNEWRRGNRLETWDRMPYSPAELGAAIDSVCDALSERDRMLNMARQNIAGDLCALGIQQSAIYAVLTRLDLSAYDASKKEAK